MKTVKMSKSQYARNARKTQKQAAQWAEVQLFKSPAWDALFKQQALEWIMTNAPRIADTAKRHN